MMRMVECTKAQALATTNHPDAVRENILRAYRGRWPKWEEVGLTRRGAKICVKRVGCITYFRLSGYTPDGRDVELDQ